MEINNAIDMGKGLTNENGMEQKSFLETTLGKVIDTGIDIGIRVLLPDFVEDQIIEIKDNLFEYGLKDGVKKTIDDAIDLGKSVLGIFTGNFESVSQMRSAIKNGGIIDGISDLLDVVIDKVAEKGVLDYSIANTISHGKDIILNHIESNIENSFDKQYEAIELLDNAVQGWQDYWKDKDFEGMEREFKKIEKELKHIAPIEKMIDNVKTIEILHNLVKNNGQDFNLSQQHLDLVEKLK